MKIKKYLEQSPIVALNTAYENMVPSINKHLHADGVNLLQGLVLTALFFEEKRNVTPSQLAELFHTSRGNISHIISHLESKSWVRRTLNPDDARGFYIELKPEGRKKALSLIKFYDQLQNYFEKQMGSLGCHRLTQGLWTMAQEYKNF